MKGCSVLRLVNIPNTFVYIVSLMSIALLVGYMSKIKWKQQSIQSDDTSVPSESLQQKRPANTIMFRHNIVAECLTGQLLKNYALNNKTCYDISHAPMPKNLKETSTNRKKSFETIYSKRYWGQRASGSGSSLSQTRQANKMLHKIVDFLKDSLKKSTITLLDLPCGDLTWMPTFLKERSDVMYTGVDIVAQLIQNHQDSYRDMFPRWTFKQMDIVANPLNESYDLILTRDALQHLDNYDVMAVMQHVSQSKSKYWMATTYHGYKNREIKLGEKNGRFRRLNLEMPPFALTPALCMTTSVNKNTYLALWKLPLTYVDNCKVMTREVPRKYKTYYSCA